MVFMILPRVFAAMVGAAYSVIDDLMFSEKVNSVTGGEAYPEEQQGVNDWTELAINVTPSTGWEVFAKSSDSPESSAYQYKAVCFINKHTQEIVIANAGTKPTNLWDLVDDVLLAKVQIGTITLKNAKVPYKMESIKSFIDNIQKKLVEDGEDPTSYQYSTSGHSLGGVLSDLCAGELISRDLNVTKAVSFESPGSRPVIEAAIQNKCFSGNVSIEALTQKVEFSTYTERPNFINSCNDAIGKVHILVAPAQDAGASEELAPASWGSYLLGKVGNIVETVANSIGLAGVYESLTSAQHHSLSNQMNFFDGDGFTVERLATPTVNYSTPIKIDHEMLGRLEAKYTQGVDQKKPYITIVSELEEDGFDVLSVYSLDHADLQALMGDTDYPIF